MTYLSAEEVQRIGNAIGLKGTFMVEWGIDHILDILDPPPKYETVETEPMWGLANKATGELTGDLFPTEESAADNIYPNYIPVKLSGTYTRPVPAKVKRRQEVSRSYCASGSNIIPEGAKFYAEWEETPWTRIPNHRHDRRLFPRCRPHRVT